MGTNEFWAATVSNSEVNLSGKWVKVFKVYACRMREILKTGQLNVQSQSSKEA